MGQIKNTERLTTVITTSHLAFKPLLSVTMFLLIALSSARIALADLGGNHSGEGHHMGWGDGGGMMLFGPVMMIGLVVLIVLVVISLMQRKSNSDVDTEKTTSSALALLNERYAKGEIDHDEYEERKRRINGS